MARSNRPNRKRELVDAAERLLVRDGLAAVTTRRVAAEADMNPALVHYHFHSVAELVLAVHERTSDEVLRRLAEIYRGDQPFLDKWREVVTTFGEQHHPKVWLETSTQAINDPELRDHVAPRLDLLRSLFVEALEKEIADRRTDRSTMPVEALAALASTALEGMALERLLGFRRGHEELVRTMEGLLRRTLST